jgi:hypothetical protein
MSSIEHEDLPNIIHMVVTASQNYAVIVTAEDKCLRVFEISPEGKLEQLSQRYDISIPYALSIKTDLKGRCPKSHVLL